MLSPLPSGLLIEQASRYVYSVGSPASRQFFGSYRSKTIDCDLINNILIASTELYRSQKFSFSLCSDYNYASAELHIPDDLGSCDSAGFL